LDIQIFPLKILAEIDKLTQDPIDRVHVTRYIYTHPEKYKIFNREADKDCYWPELRITLDEKSDYELINLIFESLLPIDDDFNSQDIISFLKKNPDLTIINKNVKTKDVKEG
jgi:spore coat polysaccharide biosynthesis protein SpsF